MGLPSETKIEPDRRLGTKRTIEGVTYHPQCHTFIHGGGGRDEINNGLRRLRKLTFNPIPQLYVKRHEVYVIRALYKYFVHPFDRSFVPSLIVRSFFRSLIRSKASTSIATFCCDKRSKRCYQTYMQMVHTQGY